MNAAIHFEGDAYVIPDEKPMGRHYAGMGFLSGLVRHGRAETITGYVKDATAGKRFVETIKNQDASRQAGFLVHSQVAKLRQVGCLFAPGLINAEQAWQRQLHGPCSWSLTGVNHTLSSARSMDAVTNLITQPFQPWDALICTSAASKDAVTRLLDRQAAYLSERLGAARFPLPQLPVIPLGVDFAERSHNRVQRSQSRASLGIAPQDIVVLFVGRLSFHAKANPIPMYLALERLCKKHSVVLIECGWFANESIEKAFGQARAKLCPTVRSIVLDGRTKATSSNAWAASDIFCSLSDNIQETFGLTPIEAMAAGLPVVVSDWDGYKDTVRDGIDGFKVPTLTPPPGCGYLSAARHALNIDTYDVYIANAAMTTSVNVDAAAKAFETLAADHELRQRMGAAGMARARSTYDWGVIVRAYERLWDELAALRNAEAEKRGPLGNAWPARPDPYELFASFPSSLLSSGHMVRAAMDLDAAAVMERLKLTVSSTNLEGRPSDETMMRIWRSVLDNPKTVGEIVQTSARIDGPTILRGVLLLSKLGLVTVTP